METKKQMDEVEEILSGQNGLNIKLISLLLELMPLKESNSEFNEDLFTSLKKSYGKLANQAFLKLKKLIDVHDIDVNSEQFKSNSKLKLEMSELIPVLCLMHDEDLEKLLLSMNFPLDFSKLFIDIEDVFQEIRLLNIEIKGGLDFTKILTYFSLTILNSQVTYILGSILNYSEEPYNGSKNFSPVRIHIKNFLRRFKRNSKKRYQGELKFLDELVKQENGVKTLQMQMKSMNRNDHGHYNLAPISKEIYSLCLQLVNDKSKSQIKELLFPLFTLLYPLRDMDAYPNYPETHLSQRADEYYYTRDFKIAQVDSIIGLTN